MLLFTSFEGFAIPHFAAARLGLSAHSLAAGPAHGSDVQELVIKIVAYSSAPTGIISFALVLWDLRAVPSTAHRS